MELVETKYGRIQGIRKEDHCLFLGIPYAAPPVGALRWRPPQPVTPWDGVLSADLYPNRSMQSHRADPFYDREFYDEPERETPFSEDGLYLNIWTPAGHSGEKLPVAFWIHGGAFLGGNGHEKEFDGAAYCRRGVILVTVNYRVGVLGFLAHPLLTAEDRALGGPGVSGNYGILDQIAALNWVRDNIAAFGGDPENITVFGQSAGCESVQTLISSPLTAGKISRAILQSGLGLIHDQTLAEAEQIGAEFAANAGASSLEELRALSFPEIEAAAGPLILQGFMTGNLPFSPNVDGVLLTAGYGQLRDGGLTHPIPYMAGSTKNDIRVDPEKLAVGDRGTVYDSCVQWSRALVQNGRSPAWVYYFTRDLPGDSAGAFHSSELWYMFGTLDRCWRPFTPEDHRLSEQMLDYWTNFMKHGDPNGEGLPLWAPCEGERDVRVLDAE